MLSRTKDHIILHGLYNSDVHPQKGELEHLIHPNRILAITACMDLCHCTVLSFISKVSYLLVASYFPITQFQPKYIASSTNCLLHLKCAKSASVNTSTWRSPWLEEIQCLGETLRYQRTQRTEFMTSPRCINQLTQLTVGTTNLKCPGFWPQTLQNPVIGKYRKQKIRDRIR